MGSLGPGEGPFGGPEAPEPAVVSTEPPTISAGRVCGGPKGRTQQPVAQQRPPLKPPPLQSPVCWLPRPCLLWPLLLQPLVEAMGRGLGAPMGLVCCPRCTPWPAYSRRSCATNRGVTESPTGRILEPRSPARGGCGVKSPASRGRTPVFRYKFIK